MPSLNHGRQTGKVYWRSLDELADTPEFREFMHREFPAGATDLLDSADRRHFLKIMGASMALAGMGLAGCRRWPEEQIVPYANRPEGHVPGVPQHFATCHELGGVASGLLVTSFDGRPVKVEGNPDHPVNAGATTALDQAIVLDLYDPDRSRSVVHRGEASSWTAFSEWLGEQRGTWRNARGNGMAILSEATSSPSVEAMRQRLVKAFPNATWYEYEPLANDHEIAGARTAFGRTHRPQFAFDRAEIIVALDSDFLCQHPAAVKHARDFATGRRAMNDAKSMSRLYAFESALTLTGAKADVRTAVRSGDVVAVATWLAARILEDGTGVEIEESERGRAALSASVVETLNHLLDDLRGHEGRSLIVAGPRQPAEVHMLAHLLNEALGNVGTTVTYTPAGDPRGHAESIRELAGRMDAGQVSTLIIIGGNPVYDAPADLDFAARLEKVASTVHLSACVDETSQRCAWHVNRAHPLESWGDGRAWDGTVCLRQPLIMPLFEGRTETELLAAVIDDEQTDAYDIVRRTLAEMTGASDAEAVWRRTLHDGVLAGSALTKETPAVRRDEVNAALAAFAPAWSATDDTGFELVFTPDSMLHDGRFANNGWLQETPDPVTKLTWDNALLMSPAAARQEGVRTGDVVTVSCNGRTLDAAVIEVPGQHDRSLTIALGYGRGFEGRVSAGAGFDAYRLRTSDAPGFATGAALARTGATYALATTQDHHAIDSVGGQSTAERLPTLVREADVREYRDDPRFAQHRTHVVHRLSLWEEDLPHQTPGALENEVVKHAWGMAIDLSACNGCSACVVACQAENNIPVVGKGQVLRSREMHWIRIDRYFKFGSNGEGVPDGNKLEGVALQPVMCVHCENAPCEQVCPVAATVHDTEGLNVMVYNRCIGTRYCSNNCPYKVRRFNYFDFHRRDPVRTDDWAHVKGDYFAKPQAAPEPLRRMHMNPEVTVRPRGVMEKCTYCVQRITNARIDAKNAWARQPEADKKSAGGYRIPDGSFTTACAQACPARAIVFGDLNDPDSEVSKLQRHERAYEMLEEINTKPRTRYLAGLRNPPVSSYDPSSGHGDGHGGADPDHAEATGHG